MSNDTPNHTTIIINNQPSANANAVNDNQSGGGFLDLLIAFLVTFAISPFGWFVIGISLLCFISAVWPLLFIIPAIYYGVKWYKKSVISDQTPVPTAAADAAASSQQDGSHTDA